MSSSLPEVHHWEVIHPPSSRKGYTGSLITRYLHAHRERKAGKFTYAIAGRNKTKLAELARAIRSDDDDSLGIYEVDVTNFDDVEKIVQQAKVIVNAVGPYWRWGKPVVKCVCNVSARTKVFIICTFVLAGRALDTASITLT